MGTETRQPSRESLRALDVLNVVLADSIRVAVLRLEHFVQ
jgi:hypothetical protein